MKLGKRIASPIVGSKGAVTSYGVFTIIDECTINKAKVVSLSFKIEAGGYKQRWSEAHEKLLNEFTQFLKSHISTIDEM
jgi:hypothetical protein